MDNKSQTTKSRQLEGQLIVKESKHDEEIIFAGYVTYTMAKTPIQENT